MPWINRPQKKEVASQRNEHTPERELRKIFYRSTQWRKARLAHIVRQPLCQECLKEGKVNAGTAELPLQVHHLRSPFQNGEINWTLGLDDSNLETICAYHHGLEHGGPEKSPEDTLKDLEDMLK